MKIKNIVVMIYIELDCFKSMYFSVACRLALADTFCCLLVILKIL